MKKCMTMNARGPAAFSVAAVASLLAVVILAACHAGPPKITIESAKAVLSPAIYGEAMVTMTIRNDGGTDVLRDVSTDIPGAKASFHIMAGKRMEHVPSVDIHGGESTIFKMGSSHIMIEDMPRTIAVGSPITLTLVFEKSGVMQLHLKLENAPAMPMSHHME